MVCAAAWLDPDQQATDHAADTGCPAGPISEASFTAIVTPQGELLGEPLRSGEGEVIGDLDFALIDKRKAFMDATGHYSRPESLSLLDSIPRPARMSDRRFPGSHAGGDVEESAISLTDPREASLDGGAV